MVCSWSRTLATRSANALCPSELVQGLGKTVEAIATCILNPSNDPSEKTTLVLAPLALLQQWKNELEEKVEKDYVSVLIYHGEPP